MIEPGGTNLIAGGTGGRDWILGVNVIKIFKIISKARITRLTFAEKCAIIFLLSLVNVLEKCGNKLEGLF